MTIGNRRRPRRIHRHRRAHQTIIPNHYLGSGPFFVLYVFGHTFILYYVIYGLLIIIFPMIYDASWTMTFGLKLGSKCYIFI